MTSKLQVLVADDHALFRESFSQLIQSFSTFDVCHESSTGQDILDYLNNNQPNIITLDLGMPGFPDNTILKSIRRMNDQVKILVVSMHDELPLIKQTIRQGADGYITKDSSTSELKVALEKMGAGENYLPRSIAEQIAFQEHKRNSTSALTPRELDILRMIAIEGLSLVEIGDRLNISPKTVTSHKGNIMLKTSASNNVELIKIAQKILM